MYRSDRSLKSSMTSVSMAWIDGVLIRKEDKLRSGNNAYTVSDENSICCCNKLSTVSRSKQIGRLLQTIPRYFP